MKRWLLNKKNLLKYKNKMLLGLYTFKELITLKEFKFSDISEDELDFFKYINDDAIINCTYFDKGIFLKFVNTLKKYNKNNKIRVTVFKDTDLSLFSHNSELDYDNIYLLNLVDNYDMPISEYREYDKLLDDIVKPAKNLCVFEKFIYAYNISKFFKEYKEETNNDKWESRNLYKILNNEYMVCVGFSVLLVTLLRKLDIPAENLGFLCGNKKYLIKDDSIVIEEDKYIEEWHSRVFLYLKDDKYGIDGYYISDPTLDNDLFEDYYNYLLVTIEENKSCCLDFISYDLNIFDIRSREDLYAKMKKHHLTNEKILSIIECIDKNFISSLKNKYEKKYEEFYSSKQVNPMTRDIADHIISKNNNKVSGKVILAGVREIYKKFYGYDESSVDEAIMKTKNKNNAMYTKDYPKVLKDGKCEINSENKFDFKYELKKKFPKNINQ